MPILADHAWVKSMASKGLVSSKTGGVWVCFQTTGTQIPGGILLWTLSPSPVVIQAFASPSVGIGSRMIGGYGRQWWVMARIFGVKRAMIQEMIYPWRGRKSRVWGWVPSSQINSGRGLGSCFLGRVLRGLFFCNCFMRWSSSLGIWLSGRLLVVILIHNVWYLTYYTQVIRKYTLFSSHLWMVELKNGAFWTPRTIFFLPLSSLSHVNTMTTVPTVLEAIEELVWFMKYSIELVLVLSIGIGCHSSICQG